MKYRSFEEWLRLVDSHIRNKCGLSHLDLPDWCYRDAYDDGVTPATAAARAIKAAKEY